MKKFFSVIFFVILIIVTSSPVYAANNKIMVDGVYVTSDVNPEISNNRIMVPLRIISENLGATVNWSDSEVTLTKNEMQVILKLNSNVVMKNGKAVQIDIKPYIKGNRTFVPLRFLAETFGCKVNYRNSTVTIDTAPLFIEGVKVKAMQHEYHMLMGGVIQQIKGNVYNKAIYNIFIENLGSKVDAPANYSWQFNLDTPGAYYKIGQYDFLNQEGRSIKCFDIYTLIGSFPNETLEGYPKVLVYDTIDNQWYLFSSTAIQSIEQLINKAFNNGFLQIVSNTVV